MQFIITGYDGTDSEAMERRMACRPAHLKSVEENFLAGRHLFGAALLGEKGELKGSLMIVDYPSREELDGWLKKEPYVTGDVWKTIDIKECKVADIFMKLYE